MSRFDVVPAGAVAHLLGHAVGVAGRHDVNVVTVGDEPLRQRSRVILHAADTVSCDGDDANPHGRRMLARRPRMTPWCAS